MMKALLVSCALLTSPMKDAETVQPVKTVAVEKGDSPEAKKSSSWKAPLIVVSVVVAAYAAYWLDGKYNESGVYNKCAEGCTKVKGGFVAVKNSIAARFTKAPVEAPAEDENEDEDEV